MNLLANQQKAETIDSVYIDLEAQLMQNIARHLRDWDKPIDTDRWLMQKLAEIGKLNKENIRIIAQMSGLSITAAEQMLYDMAEEAIQNMEPGFRYMVREGLADEAVKAGRSKNVKQVMEKLQQQAKDTLNLTNTTMLHKAQESFKTLVQETSKMALEIMNNNTAAVITGAESRQQALRRTIKQFNEQGITGFVDKRGRNWTPEAYVNMSMRATSKNVAEEVQTARILDHGVNLIIISSHSGARPKCAKDQGKIFDLNNESGTTKDLNGREARYYPWSSSSYGDPDGILGINCHHHKYPYIPGVSIQRYFPTDDMDANNKLYKETQVQRALERDVRKQKRECMMFDTLGDKDAFEDAAVKLKAKEAKLKNYVDTHDNLHRRKDREQVVGFDKRISAEAIAANKKTTRTSAKNVEQIQKHLQDDEIQKHYAARREEWKKKRAEAAEPKNVDDINKVGTKKMIEAYENNRISNNLKLAPAKDFVDKTPDIIKVDYGNIDFRIARSFNDTISDLVDDYNTPLQKITTMEKEAAFFQKSIPASTSHNYNMYSAKMELNPLLMKDGESYLERVKTAIKKGQFPDISDELAEKYVPTHEFAHTLLSTKELLPVKNNWSGMDFKDIRHARLDIKMLYQEYLDDINNLKSEKDSLYKKFFDGVINEEEIARLKAVETEIKKLKISNYASTNADEFFAEAFVDAKIGKAPSEYSMKVLDIIDQNFKKSVTKIVDSDIINSGAVSGARNPFGKAAKQHAEKYYGLVRSMSTDVAKIARTTGYTEEEIQRIKNYIFVDAHDLGDGTKRRFDPDYMMSESWRRLIDGKPEQHDLTMLKHEIMENELMSQGMSQDEAHIKTSAVYNYDKEANEYYGKINKYKKE